MLSLVLMAASAATAAFAHRSEKKVAEDANGLLVNAGGVNPITSTNQTCQTDPGNVNTNCHNTIDGINNTSSAGGSALTGDPTSDGAVGNTTAGEDLVH